MSYFQAMINPVPVGSDTAHPDPMNVFLVTEMKEQQLS